MTLIALAAITAVIVATAAIIAGRQAKLQLAEMQARLAAAQRQLEDQHKLEAQLREDVSKLKQTLREEKDALKALKKKAFDAKKAPAPVEPKHASSNELSSEMAEQVRELDRQWRLQAEQLARAEQVLKQAQAEAAALQDKLQRAEAAKTEVADLRARLEAEKQRSGADAKSVLDMRRKIEWYRRIHLVQKNELQVERDRTAHVRQRLLEVCGELVRFQQRPVSAEQQAEIDRLKREEAAYQTANAKQGQAELH